VSLLTADQNLPFGIGFALIVGIALVEGVGMLVSFSPSNLLDDLVPDINGDSGLDRVLGWLHLGKVPALVILLLFLTGYTVFGYGLQMVSLGLLGHYLPASVAGLLAVPSGLATVRGLGALIAHIIPRDETSSVSEQTLLGRVGVIVAGAAKRGLAAQARVKDTYGRSHYLMVEPDLDDEILDEGTNVLIVRKVGAFYRCIANPHPSLM
jgi:Protein of unknown function (DUF1449)